MRELSNQPLARDPLPALWVKPSQWVCTWCPITEDSELADNDGGAPTTVVWLAASIGVDGRCLECGQKYVLTKAFEAVPSAAEQMERWPK